MAYSPPVSDAQIRSIIALLIEFDPETKMPYTMQKACKVKGVSVGCFWNRCRDDVAMMQSYTRARETQAIMDVDDIASIEGELRAKTLDSQAARVIIDAKKWRASKMHHLLFGDRIGVDMTMRAAPDWSRLSEGAREEIRALLEAQVSGVGAGAGTGPLIEHQPQNDEN